MFSRDLVYVLSAIVINNIIIAAIIVINMRRIVEYIREEIVKVQMDHSILFEYADVHFGFYKDALDIIDDDIHALKETLQLQKNGAHAETEPHNIIATESTEQCEHPLYKSICDIQTTIHGLTKFMASQKVYNLSHSEYLTKLDNSIKNINTHVAQNMRKHTDTIESLIADTECAFDEKAQEIAATVADIPNWAVYYTTPLRDICVKISRSDIHKYTDLTLCQYYNDPNAVLNLSGCTFNTIYVTPSTVCRLYDSLNPSKPITIHNLEFVLNYEANEINNYTQIKNNLDIMNGTVITGPANPHVWKCMFNHINIHKITVSIILFVPDRPTFVADLEFITSFIQLFTDNIIKVNIRLNSANNMILNINRKYKHNTLTYIQNGYNTTYNQLVERILKMQTDFKATLQTDCDIPYDYAKNKMIESTE